MQQHLFLPSTAIDLVHKQKPFIIIIKIIGNIVHRVDQGSLVTPIIICTLETAKTVPKRGT